MVKFLTKSIGLAIPKSSNVSLSMTESGDADLLGSRLMYEPVTMTSSVSADCANAACGAMMKPPAINDAPTTNDFLKDIVSPQCWYLGEINRPIGAKIK